MAMSDYETQMERKRRALEGADPNATTTAATAGATLPSGVQRAPDGGVLFNRPNPLGAAGGARFLRDNATTGGGGGGGGGQPVSSLPPARAVVTPGTRPLGRAIGDALAGAVDGALMVPKAGVDLVNRAAIGVRNIAADAVDARRVQPADMNYAAAQQALANVRSQNRAARNAPAAAAPATGDPVAATKAAIAASEAQRAAVRQRFLDNAKAATTGAVVPAATGAKPLRTLDGREGSVASGVGANGENVYDNASIARLEARNGAGSVSSQSGLAVQPGAVAPAQIAAEARYGAPTSGLRGNNLAAERERQARLSEIDSQIADLGELNSRGKRALYAQLQEQKNGLVRLAVDEAGELTRTGATLDAQGEQAALGANSRADEASAQLASSAFENRQNRAQAYELAGDQVEGANGNEYVRRGNRVDPVTGADGKPFRGKDPLDKNKLSDKDALDALIAQQSVLSDLTDPDGSQRAAIATQIQQLFAGSGKPVAKGASEPPAAAIEFLRKNPDKAAEFDAKYGAGAAARYQGK